jgi:hypothetical protein
MEGKKKEVWHLENDPPKQALGFSKCLPFIDEVILLHKMPSNYTERLGGGFDVLMAYLITL